MTAPTEPVPAPEPLVEPGRPYGWWEETPAQAARFDRWWGENDYDLNEEVE